MPFSFLSSDNCISGILYLKFEYKLYLRKDIIAEKVFLPLLDYGQSSVFCHFRKLENLEIFIGNNNKGYNEMVAAGELCCLSDNSGCPALDPSLG